MHKKVNRMKKIIVMLIGFGVLSAAASSIAATAKCQVVQVKGNKVQLQCSQIVGKIKKGEWVKVKTEG